MGVNPREAGRPSSRAATGGGGSIEFEQPIAPPADVEHVAAVEQAIADRVGDGRVAEVVMPASDGELAGEGRRAVAVAILDDLKQEIDAGKDCPDAVGLDSHGRGAGSGCRELDSLASIRDARCRGGTPLTSVVAEVSRRCDQLPHQLREAARALLNGWRRFRHRDPRALCAFGHFGRSQARGCQRVESP